jgi:hypothetical protein
MKAAVYDENTQAWNAPPSARHLGERKGRPLLSSTSPPNPLWDIWGSEKGKLDLFLLFENLNQKTNPNYNHKFPPIGNMTSYIFNW